MSTQICRGFTDDQWRELNKRLIRNGDEAAWDCAIKVFERRINERFLSSIEALEKADSRAADDEVAINAPADCSTLPKDSDTNLVVPGFAIMALCCLLIETLESFRKTPVATAQAGGPCTFPAGNCIRPQPLGSKLIREFLQRPSFGESFSKEEVAKDFVRGVRDGILHEAETRRWVIWREEPRGRIVERHDKRYFVNRTAFFHALRQEFEAYVSELRDSRNVGLRKRFIKKMDDIAKNC